MRKIAFLLAGIFSFLLADAQDKDCKKFHYGTYSNVNEGTGINTLIERKGNIQTETANEGKSKASFIVKWQNDCSYTLKPTKETFRNYPDWPKNALFTIEITETGEDSYKQESSSNFTDVKITNVIKRVK